MEAIISITSHHRHRGATAPISGEAHQHWLCAMGGKSICHRNFKSATKSATICSLIEHIRET